MKNILFPLTIVVLLSGCKKKDDDPTGNDEARKIEQAVIGHNYKVADIKDQNGNDAAAQFPACLPDDLYYFKDRGTVVITQGAIKCGQEAGAQKNASWALGFDVTGVSALQFPIFLKDQNFYSTREFPRGLFSVNTTNGAISLLFKVGSDTYSINLVQTL